MDSLPCTADCAWEAAAAGIFASSTALSALSLSVVCRDTAACVDPDGSTGWVSARPLSIASREVSSGLSGRDWLAIPLDVVA